MEWWRNRSEANDESLVSKNANRSPMLDFRCIKQPENFGMQSQSSDRSGTRM